MTAVSKLSMRDTVGPLLEAHPVLCMPLQEQKRQRLREAGRRKLEEFKRRNVESLPSETQLGTRSFSGSGLLPIAGLPMAAMAAIARGAAGPMDMADLAHALPGDRHARVPTQLSSDGISGGRRLPLRADTPADGRHSTAAGAEQANGHQNESAPVSRASSTNSAILQGLSVMER